jgi:hypothetical protein
MFSILFNSCELISYYLANQHHYQLSTPSILVIKHPKIASILIGLFQRGMGCDKGSII